MTSLILNHRIDSSDVGVLYRNFEGAILEASNATWYVTSDYNSLEFLNGMNMDAII